MRKGEADLMMMVRKVIIHSRVVAPTPQQARRAEDPPDGEPDSSGRHQGGSRNFHSRLASRWNEWDSAHDHSALYGGVRRPR
jgi:hypothetical protein